ncbi:MAG: c-type cytochrome [Gammaproteobacteria bacterium]|nr:c-type cytochrome [Gammaproteobacteria bacterium]MDH3464911.1 c-type cytochrome [Gammaproteobacteria bacterium]
MTSLGNSLVGLIFLTVAAALTFLMFYIWKFPFDHEQNTSHAPPSLIRTHRLLGYVYVVIYIYLMWQMVPRLWAYQIELPPRTVMHLTLGISIGALLITKLTIVRFFKHMEATLVPLLGSALFICTFLLISLALPFSLREVYLQSKALNDDEMSATRIARVREHLPRIGLDNEQLLNTLATREGLLTGRRTLTVKCIQCHDLRTVLARPRTPQNWQQTVARMANRSTILNPITQEDQWYVTAYLIAVSPTLQETLRQRRQLAMTAVESQQSVMSAMKMVDDPAEDSNYDAQKARAVFEQTCSQCHAYTLVENARPGNKDEAAALVQRMVGNGLVAGDEELNTVIRYLTETYAGGGEATPTTTAIDTPEPSAKEPDAIIATDTMAGFALDGESLYSQRLCITCHGPGGKVPIGPNYPILAGQNKDYLVQQIIDIKTSLRNNGITSVMSSIVQNVSDEEIEAISGYLSGVE